MRLRTIDGCHKVTAGYYSPRGSAAPIPCPGSGYRCPGARTGDGDGGGEPVRLGRGGVRQSVNLTLEIDELTMPLALTAAGTHTRLGDRIYTCSDRIYTYV